jgi:hypothetical protein
MRNQTTLLTSTSFVSCHTFVLSCTLVSPQHNCCSRCATISMYLCLIPMSSSCSRPYQSRRVDAFTLQRNVVGLVTERVENSRTSVSSLGHPIFQDFPTSPPATSPPMSDVAVFIPLTSPRPCGLWRALPRSSRHGHDPPGPRVCCIVSPAAVK